MENLTLIVVLTLLNVASSAALFLNWAGNRSIPGLFLIAFGFTLSGAGILLLSTLGEWPLIVSIVLSNSLILLGRIPLMIGLANFWNQESSKLIVANTALCLLTIIGLYYLTIVNDDPLWRTRIYTITMVIGSLSYLYIVSNGLRLERKLRPVVNVSSNYGAFMVMGMSAFNAVAELVMMFLRADAPLDSTHIGTSIFLLGAIFTALVFPLIVLIMTMEELNIEHQENAIYDPITDILNHRSFLEVGHKVMGIALRYGKPVSLLTIEIDNIDKVMKKFGTNVLNEMLRHFSLIATDRRRNEDVLARTSFKEFRVLLPGVDEHGCEAVIKKIIESVRAEKFFFRGEEVPVSISIASITKKEEGLNLTKMLQEGEVELHRLRLAAL